MPAGAGHDNSAVANTPTMTTADANSGPQLVYWQGVALLTAECLGVGVLALPNDIQTLGYPIGLTFLLINVPINFFAGNLLHHMAQQIEDGSIPSAADNDDLELQEEVETNEERAKKANYHEKNSDRDTDDGDNDDLDDEVEMVTMSPNHSPSSTTINTIHYRHSKQPPQIRLPSLAGDVIDMEPENDIDATLPTMLSPSPQANKKEKIISETVFEDEPLDHDDHGGDSKSNIQGDSNQYCDTQDVIGMSKTIFESRRVIHVVILVYYLNLFLILGNYKLVMGRAVSALFLDQICIPVAGAVSGVFMFVICQLRTMAVLGRSVSLISLVAMLVVLVLCLVHHRAGTLVIDLEDKQEKDIWSQFSALGSIGYAVGSPKLFLNIRHELRRKEDAPKVLVGSLITYGLAYLVVVVLAGTKPPSFLFNSIPEGVSRRVAGFFLWLHVAVSYSISSQALCSSMDRFLTLCFSRWGKVRERLRWLSISFVVAVASYVVANAIPFFKDMVALIGALTTIPLTMMLPPLLHRHFHRLRLFLLYWKSKRRQIRSYCGSCSLLLYSVVFFVVALAGAISSINEDWLYKGQPFSCRRDWEEFDSRQK